MQNNYQKIANVWVIVLLLSLAWIGQSDLSQRLTPQCEDKTYKTLQTKCAITFTACQNSDTHKFVNCSVTNCQRHLGTQNCQRSLDFTLSEEACYRQCCKSHFFNLHQCSAVNESLKVLRESQDSFIMLGTYRLMHLVLILVVGGLVIFTLTFFFGVLKCNKKAQNQLNDQKSDSLINWMETKYFDVKCDVCMSYGAVILTPCNHAYHEKCYFNELKNDEIRCAKCPEKMFSALKIVCGECREKQFKIRVSKGSVLKEIIGEGMMQHEGKCEKGGKEVCTDVRLTSTGSSD